MIVRFPESATHEFDMSSEIVVNHEYTSIVQ